jgi:hypothetical protein
MLSAVSERWVGAVGACAQAATSRTALSKIPFLIHWNDSVVNAQTLNMRLVTHRPASGDRKGTLDRVRDNLRCPEGARSPTTKVLFCGMEFNW